MSVSETHAAWHEPPHIARFDKWSKLSTSKLRKTLESFNEVRLFVENEPRIRRTAFAEIGCATGELYRYLREFYPRFTYYGFDISVSAIDRARQKYPRGKFFVCPEDLSGIGEHCATPSVLFARDVIPHQEHPFEFMARLVSMAAEAAILRIRTRDVGATVLDPALSCAFLYQKWIPYFVLNVDEVVSTIKKAGNLRVLHIRKHYQQLGGLQSRFLPKECYLPETGTAETAVYVEWAPEPVAEPEIVIEAMPDSKMSPGVLERGLRFIRDRVVQSL